MREACIAVAIVVLLAGCSGAAPGGDAGAVDVYVSDEPGAIDQFEHVNLTISELSLRTATASTGHDDEGRHRHRHHGNWTTYDLNRTTVDLTELRGVNASLLHTVGVPPGEYTAVSVTVAGVNATLENGEHATVRVPNDRLTVREAFTVGDGESTEFVVDAVVRERGDGYVLVPNVEHSGTDVAIRHCGCCHDDQHGNWSHGGGGMHDGHHNGTDDGCRHG